MLHVHSSFRVNLVPFRVYHDGMEIKGDIPPPNEIANDARMMLTIENDGSFLILRVKF